VSVLLLVVRVWLWWSWLWLLIQQQLFKTGLDGHHHKSGGSHHDETLRRPGSLYATGRLEHVSLRPTSNYRRQWSYMANMGFQELVRSVWLG
jgi:alpha-tubulin suppressor-like RCC1 family protein